MCSVGDLVQFTQNDKGTIKIIKEGSEKFVNQPTHNQIDDDVIMIQCMFKAASAFYAHKSSITEIQVSETAKLWFESAKEILKKKTNKSDEAPF